MLDIGAVEKALYLMRNVGLIEYVNAEQVISKDFCLGPDGIPSRAIKNYHHMMLDKASEAIENQAIEKRDISGISFCVKKEDISNLKNEILNFQKKIIEKYSGKKSDAVYHMETALFALSKEEL